MNKFELEDRLIDFSVSTIAISKKLKDSFEGVHLSKQLIRSASSSALNYGEARSAESTKDFIHKMQIVLKELRESFINLKIIKRAELLTNNQQINSILKENDELISIFVKSISTAKKNRL